MRRRLAVVDPAGTIVVADAALRASIRLRPRRRSWASRSRCCSPTRRWPGSVTASAAGLSDAAAAAVAGESCRRSARTAPGFRPTSAGTSVPTSDGWLLIMSVVDAAGRRRREEARSARAIRAPGVRDVHRGAVRSIQQPGPGGAGAGHRQGPGRVLRAPADRPRLVFQNRSGGAAVQRVQLHRAGIRVRTLAAAGGRALPLDAGAAARRPAGRLHEPATASPARWTRTSFRRWAAAPRCSCRCAWTAG